MSKDEKMSIFYMNLTLESLAASSFYFDKILAYFDDMDWDERDEYFKRLAQIGFRNPEEFAIFLIKTVKVV